MGNYNPHAPYILGNEWVPIRSASYAPDFNTEIGYTFGIEHATTIVSGTYTTLPSENNDVLAVAEVFHLYKEGTEDLAGPIRQVVIPASAIAVTGAGGSFSTLPNNPAGDGLILQNGNAPQIGVSFDVTSFAQALNGKRILDVGFEYLAQGAAESLNNVNTSVAKLGNVGLGILYANGVKGQLSGGADIQYISLGELNPWWEPGIFNVSAPVRGKMYPWRLQELLNFNSTTSGSDRMIAIVQANLLGTIFDSFIPYFNLRVTYCEEQRLLAGGDYLASSTVFNIYSDNQPKFIAFRDLANLALPGSLPAGRYSITQSHTNLGFTTGAQYSPPQHALRELYQLPPQRGITVNRTYTIDEQFTLDDSPTLPQITLHHPSGPVTGAHGYGIQDDVPVYGTTVAIQEIEDDPVGAVKSYPQVRFYARRFGNTTAPLRIIDVAAGTSIAQISPAEHDALPQLVDGYKEVTLRFGTAPTFGTAAGDVDYRFDAVGEAAANRWEVLGAGSISPTGTQAIGPCTYGAPVGDTVTLTWQSPYVSGAGANDLLSDATLIFSTDPPAITGFALGTCTQVVTGAGLISCGTPNGCVPTGIYGNQLSWTNSAVCDPFSRTLAASWGNADSTGQAWSVTGGAPTDYNVAAGVGTMTITGTAVPHQAFITVNRDAQDVRCGPIIIPAVPTGATIEADILIRRNTSTGNWYSANLSISTAGVATLSITKNISGTITSLGSIALPLPHTAGSQYFLRAQITDSIIKVKGWTAADTEPGWQVTVTDTAILTGTQAGVRAIRNTSNTNGTVIVSFDNFQALQADLAEGFYEIQRYDAVDGFWSSVMDTRNLCVTGMCDYEARVGVPSIYRMRTRNILDFAGPWVSGSATIPAPGVQGTTGNSLLAFTSNKAPLSNLAYIMQFNGKPVESFTFPEADLVQFQRMYGTDFYTAFHPLERGGERFQRVILVSAAAVPLPSLGNFRTLRDLAWADLPYVCVRDELGNRWYATVLVPSGEVRKKRTLYLAAIEVVETSRTSCAIDPS